MLLNLCNLRNLWIDPVVLLTAQCSPPSVQDSPSILLFLDSVNFKEIICLEIVPPVRLLGRAGSGRGAFRPAALLTNLQRRG